MRLFILGVLLAAPILSHADTDDPLIVITATGNATPAHQLAALTTVISRDEIDKRQAQTVAELLRNIPGLHLVQSGSGGQQASVYVRGSNSNHVLVLVDGFKISDTTTPSGAFDFANLGTDMIERIEIVRGPQSTLYGSEAIGGVINIITRQPQGNRASVSLSGGSHTTDHEALLLQDGNTDTGFLLSLSHRRSDGETATAPVYQASPVDNDGSETTEVLLKTRFTLGETTTLQLQGSITEASTQFDASADESPLPVTELDEWLLASTLTSRLDDGRIKSQLKLAKHRTQRLTTYDFGGFPLQTDFNSERLQADWRNDFFHLAGHQLTAGLHWEQEDALSIFGMPTGYRAITRSAYLQDQFTLTDQLSGTLGLRHDRHDRFGGETTWRLGLVYQLPESGITLRGSHGTGFKAPSLYQLYDSFSGNGDLQPENSRGSELGISWSDERVTTGFTLFHNRLENLIDYDFNSFQIFNVGEATTRGVESFVAWQPASRWQARLDYTYLETEDVAGDALLRRPAHKADLVVDYTPGTDWKLSIAAHYTGSRVDLVRGAFPEQRVDMPSFTTVDVAVEYHINPQVSITGKAVNLFDRDYQPAHGYAGAGRAFYAGLKVKL